MKDRVFGDIPGIYEGQEFENRIELSLSLVHRPIQAGISGSQGEGADSIVLSGGYEDDEDYGDTIIYTGHGGRDIGNGKQVTNQELIKQNLALALNCQQGLPLRVIRGAKNKSVYSPDVGYRYDGLFRVEDYWREKGKTGFYIWRYKLVKISKELNERYIQKQDEFKFEEPEEEYMAANRIETRILRIIRDTELSKKVKEMYKYHCQICDQVIETNAGLYAEAAHIRPLGAPHNGPDILGNILCLCPNHHVKFDFGGFSILDDFTLIGEKGKLNVDPSHKIDKEFLKYHREHFFEET